MCFSLVRAHCSRTLLITAVLNTSWSFKSNAACSMGRTLWAVLSITKGVVAAWWQWQRLLGCSGPWHSGPITISERKKTTKKHPHRQSPVRWRSAMPSARRFDWSRQNSHDHITRMNADRKLPKEPDCHCSMLPLVFTTKLFLIFSPPLSVCVCVCYPNVVLFFFLSFYQPVTARCRSPFL